MPPNVSSTDSDAVIDNDVTQIIKALRRLKIHFPSYGDGFCYLLLREYNFDCCEAIEALSTHSFPEGFKTIPLDLDLETARQIINNDIENEDNISSDSKYNETVSEGSGESPLSHNDLTQSVLRRTSSFNKNNRDCFIDNPIVENVENHLGNSLNSVPHLNTQFIKDENLLKKDKQIGSIPSKKIDGTTSDSSEDSENVVYNYRRRQVKQIIESDKDHETSEDSDDTSIMSSSFTTHIQSRHSPSHPSFSSNKSSSNRVSVDSLVIEQNLSLELSGENNMKLETTSRSSVEFKDAFESHIDLMSNVEEISSQLLHPSNYQLSDKQLNREIYEHNQPNHVDLCSNDIEKKNIIIPSLFDTEKVKQSPSCVETKDTDIFHDVISDTSDLLINAEFTSINTLSDPLKSNDIKPVILPKKPQEGRRQIQLFDSDSDSSHVHHTIHMKENHLSILNKEETTPHTLIKHQHSDDMLSPDRRPVDATSIDLLRFVDYRRQQTVNIHDIVVSQNSPKITSQNNISSPYIAALDGYLEQEKTLQHDDTVLIDLLNTTTQIDIPGIEDAGFHWWPSKKRFFRSSLGTPYLRPRHRFLLGPGVYNELYNYQKFGVSWMFELFKLRRGGILADEMGLGKTVQATAFLRGLFSSKLATHALILLPLTLLTQWKTHLARWCSKSTIAIFHGSKSERRSALNLCLHSSTGCVLLTTYETFRNSCAELIRVQHNHSDDMSSNTQMLVDAVSETPVTHDINRTDDEQEWKQLILSEIEDNKQQGSRPWDVVILDEAHKIKNPNNQCAQAVRLVHSHCRILLTGTPVSNSLDELWSLMDCAQPGLLGNHRTFKAEFSDPIKFGSARDAPEFAVARKNKITLELQQLVVPFFLRRTVSDTLHTSPPSFNNGMEHNSTDMSVGETSHSLCSAKTTQELPKKTDIVVWIGLTPEQEHIYTEFLSSRHIKTIFNSSDQTRKGFNSMRAVGILLKICRHPAFLLPQELQQWRYIMDSKNEETSSPCHHNIKNDRTTTLFNDNKTSHLTTQFINESWFQDILHLQLHTPEDLRALSGKLKFLYAVLPSLEKKHHRCLIFSQSTKMLDMVQLSVLHPLGIQYLRIDGSVSNDIRQQRIKQYQTETNIFALLMTTKVGGQGLNLACADRVIIIDPDWTPANDNQAVARIYRLGQTKPVVVYRLFTAGAIEDHAFRLQTFKQGLSKIALERVNQKTYFSEADMKQIFTLRTGGISETLEILDIVDPQKKESRQALIEIVKNDIGNDVYNSLWEHLIGLSDFDALHKELSGATDVSNTHAAMDAEKAVKSSVHKLRSEKYDETQLINIDFLKKATDKLRDF